MGGAPASGSLVILVARRAASIPGTGEKSFARDPPVYGTTGGEVSQAETIQGHTRLLKCSLEVDASALSDGG